MGNEFTDQNPYESPATASFSISKPDPAGSLALIKQFRTQIHALGVLWIVIGPLNAALAIGLLFGTKDYLIGMTSTGSSVSDFLDISAAIFGFLCVAWFAIGLLACLKILPAIYSGLVLSYMTLVFNCLSLNLCMALVFGAAIIQGHRVIAMAVELRKQGIPLNAKAAL